MLYYRLALGEKVVCQRKSEFWGSKTRRIVDKERKGKTVGFNEALGIELANVQIKRGRKWGMGKRKGKGLISSGS